MIDWGNQGAHGKTMWVYEAGQNRILTYEYSISVLGGLNCLYKIPYDETGTSKQAAVYNLYLNA